MGQLSPESQMLTPQFILALASKLVIDLFAGGGGASTGIEQALGRHVDVAINHDADAIGMHAVNHPQTRHYRADVREVDPLAVTRGMGVGLLHASPDCTHHSQALGGQPRSEEIRSLAWVVHRWAGKTRPDLITLENVAQMLDWAPLIAKRCPTTGRVITLDKVLNSAGKTVYRVADPGEVVPRHNQFLVPDPKRKSRNWKHFVEGLRAMGYKVEWRVICNATVGAHSTRTRLYMIARCDGLPIVWPEQTHARKPKGKQKPFEQAADCIDWSIPGTSIFGRKKSLVPASLRRIAYGLRKFVLESDNPFVVEGAARALIPVGHGERRAGDMRSADLAEPLGTLLAGGGKYAIAGAYLVQAGHGEGSGATKRWGAGANSMRDPIGAVTASSVSRSLATAIMVQANGGFNSTHARDLRDGVSTITTRGSQQQLVTAHLATLRHHSIGRDLREPIATIAAGGEHHALVQYRLSRTQEEGALRCAEFLREFSSGDTPTSIKCADRQTLLELVTVWIDGDPWIIVDITLRMLVPRELYNAQDFPAHYIIDRTAEGKKLTQTAQVRMAGNSVSPLPMRLIVGLNHPEAANCSIRKVA